MTAIHPDVADRYADLLLGSMMMQLGDHVGVFYRGEADRDAVVVPVIASALEARCAVVYVCDRSEPVEVSDRLAAAGIDVGAAVGSGQLHVLGGAEAYVGEGRFEPQRTVDFYRRTADMSLSRGFPVLVVIGEMSWSLSDCPGTERLLEYEALYAEQFARTSTVTLCLYDLEQTGGGQILDLLRLHQRVVVNGMEQQNPHVEPGLLFPDVGLHG
jgi:two-component system, chemotaxis family, sensor kinase Cph1